MFGCESLAAARASAMNRSRRSASAAMSGPITLIATVRPRRVSRARNTSPRPPAPMRSRILYCPSVSIMRRDDYTDRPGRSRTRRSDITVTYTALLRRNRNFRLLFIGQTISQLGDWFNAVAVFALLLDLTGSATAVAWMMIVQFLPV